MQHLQRMHIRNLPFTRSPAFQNLMRIMAFLPLCRIAPWLFCPLADSPSHPGRFALCWIYWWFVIETCVSIDRKATSVSSRHWLTVTSINVIGLSIRSTKTTVSHRRLRNSFLTWIANNFEKHLQILDLCTNWLGLKTNITHKPRCRITGIQRGESSKVRGRISQGVNKPGGEQAKERTSQGANGYG